MAIRLLILRHGPAGDKESFKAKTGKTDNLRPLTTAGKDEARAISRFIKKNLSSLDVIFTSPYKRALQTANILAKRYKTARVVTMKELRPQEDVSRAFSTLRNTTRVSNIAIVGREPHLTKFLTYVLTGHQEHLFNLKKSGFAIVEFSNRFEIRHAKLLCLVQPSQVKKARKKS